ncbi:MAG: hypothetical protein M3Q89_12920, partial [Verrucomicrobiota bacterium]|nr:hypothetical protein [Verrucomicrobiota bacterium]
TLSAPKGGSVRDVSVAGSVVTVNLTGVANEQTVMLTLNGLTDGSNIGPATIPMGVLLGDVNATRNVDGNDVSAVQAKTRQPVSATTFKFDVNVTGVIDGNDVSTVQGKTRTRLP